MSRRKAWRELPAKKDGQRAVYVRRDLAPRTSVLKWGMLVAIDVMIVGSIAGWSSGPALAFAALFLGLAGVGLANYLAFRAGESNLILQPFNAAVVFVASLGLAATMLLASLTT